MTIAVSDQWNKIIKNKLWRGREEEKGRRRRGGQGRDRGERGRRRGGEGGSGGEGGEEKGGSGGEGGEEKEGKRGGEEKEGKEEERGGDRGGRKKREGAEEEGGSGGEGGEEKEGKRGGEEKEGSGEEGGEEKEGKEKERGGDRGGRRKREGAEEEGGSGGEGGEEKKGKKEICQLYEADLLQVDSAAEEAVIEGILKRLHGSVGEEVFWTDGVDLLTEGEWRWAGERGESQLIDGYTNWAPGQPDNAGGEHCLEIRYDFGFDWNDHGCSEKKDFICEAPYETGGISVIG
ncbi:TATA-binding protein-associated factor 2N-like [Ylistrum balloti]|uniref:TATA-binding protein-associated factor 2N-like n=1 Tax=Ylistrum balloti TaxID=509963 RepID=UPI002905ADF6|nr:TATA-binding protein-associated factor 2N-like [Ylistrum balloti]